MVVSGEGGAWGGGGPDPARSGRGLCGSDVDGWPDPRSVAPLPQTRAHLSNPRARPQAGGQTKKDRLVVQRSMGREQPVAYEITDIEPRHRQDWERVVAVLCSGKAWQFKKWPFRGASQGDLLDTFQRVCGFYLHYGDEAIEPAGEGLAERAWLGGDICWGTVSGEDICWGTVPGGPGHGPTPPAPPGRLPCGTRGRSGGLLRKKTTRCTPAAGGTDVGAQTPKPLLAVKTWKVKVFPLSRENRHRDVTVVQDMFKVLDAFLAARKSRLHY